MYTPDYTQHTKKDLVNFTRVMGVFFLLLTTFLLYRNDFALTPVHQTLIGISLAWLLWGVLHPNSTKPFYHVWMWFAFGLNFVMTRVVLSILFYGIALPTALFLRLTGKDLLGIKAEKPSYWKNRTAPTSHKHFEKLYTIRGSEDNA